MVGRRLACRDAPRLASTSLNPRERLLEVRARGLSDVLGGYPTISRTAAPGAAAPRTSRCAFHPRERRLDHRGPAERKWPEQESATMSPLNKLRGLGRDDVSRVRVVKAEVSSPRPCGFPGPVSMSSFALVLLAARTDTAATLVRAAAPGAPPGSRDRRATREIVSPADVLAGRVTISRVKTRSRGAGRDGMGWGGDLAGAGRRARGGAC